MEKGEYFQAALSNFMFDVSSGGAIRHLADRGYNAVQIMKRLDFPTPYDRIQQTMWEHFLQTGIVRMEEPGTAVQKEEYDYVAQYDSYGRKSFRRVILKSRTEEPIIWKESVFSCKTRNEFSLWLNRQCEKNGEETAYISCDFGLRSRRDPKQYQETLTLLEETDREYVEGLLWERKIVYHRLNKRMRDIAVCLYKGKAFSGVCYFMEIKEKVQIPHLDK